MPNQKDATDISVSDINDTEKLLREVAQRSSLQDVAIRKLILSAIRDYGALQMAVLSQTYGGRITNSEHEAMVALEDTILDTEHFLK